MDRLMVTVSGVRGTIGRTLTPQVACDFGCAFGAMLGPDAVVTLARDTRTSGPMLRSAVAAGLLASGVDVIDLGVATTPGAAFMTRRLGADGGVVITASHNPIEYNGLKCLQPTGTALRAEDAGRLKALYESRDFAMVGPMHQGTLRSDDSTVEQHVSAVVDAVDADAIAARGFTVVLDSINGAGCLPSPLLLERLGCGLVHLNAEPTGVFAHTPEPVAENLDDLCKAVVDSGADVGFAQDPDADRLAIVDETGCFIGEEYTLALTAAYVLRHRTGPMVTNLVTSRMLDDIAAAAGCEVTRTPTGEANVVTGMEEVGAVFGGEGGGGAIEPKIVPVRDSLVAIAYLLQYLAETGSTVSQLVDQIPRYVMRKIKFPCPADGAPKVVAATREALAGREGATFNDADGLRVDLPEGWLCVRASNTEPIMRIIGEARDAETIDALVAEVRQIADKALGAG